VNQYYCNEVIFRPTIVIETEEPYTEEEIQEARVDNVMFRQIGPCNRCKSCMMQWNANARSPILEPYQTLSTHRKQDGGMGNMIFGIYFQPDMIETEEDFNELLEASYKLDE
jgi:uncharacterized protein YcbX